MTTIIADVFRYDPTTDTGPRMQQYEVSCERPMTVMCVLRHIYEEIDATLAFRNYQCSRGICSSCRINLNGRQVKACSVPARPGDHLVIRPYQEKRVIRDLVCYDE